MSAKTNLKEMSGLSRARGLAEALTDQESKAVKNIAIEIVELISDAQIGWDADVKWANKLLLQREALEEYASHQSWRCEHPDRYPWEPDCPCGLTGTLRELNIEMMP